MDSKKYLVSITSGRGAVCSIAYYADTTTKNYRIYQNGSDTGSHYDRLGNASRRLEEIARAWETRSGVRIIDRQQATRDEIPQRGSNARKAV